MSQYVNFYIKETSGRRIPIGSYSRNTTMFAHCDSIVPYGVTKQLDNNNIADIIQSIENEIKEDKQTVVDFENHIKDIYNYNNSIEEKEELITSYRSTIKEIMTDIEAANYAIGVLRTYCDINDALEYSDEQEWTGIEAGVEA